MIRFFFLLILMGIGIASAADLPSASVRIAVVRNQPSLRQVFRALGGREYPGTVRVLSTKQGYTAINTLDLEDYLRGVIGAEMDPKAPLEALKAQAIAARSHALYQISISGDQPYDLVANLSQAYLGKGKLSKNVILAIEATRGQVLYFKGKPIPAFFHDSCGGHTETVASVWTEMATGIKLPGATVCPYCAASKDRKWSFDLTANELQRVLTQAGYRVGTPTSIHIPAKADGGHALTVVIQSDTGVVVLPAEKLRSILGYSHLRSTLFQVSTQAMPSTAATRFVFQGDGYGHGVGLCQYGARAMALGGARCDTILSRYFPSAMIQPYSESHFASTD